jgi:uncharacterized membrane protein YhaH (DUF805 family)
MATLKKLVENLTNSSSLDFRNNDNASADGTLWANAWVEGKEGKLLCIGATVATLEQLDANPKLDTLMLTKPEPKIDEKTGLEYDMCQLFIDDKIKMTFDFSNKNSNIESNEKTSIKTNNSKQELIKSIIISVIIAIIIGYIFSNDLYYKKGNEISYKIYQESINKNSIIIKESFNFKFAALTFSFVSGFMFFVYYDENRKSTFLKNLNSIRYKFGLEKDVQKLLSINFKKNLLNYLKNKIFNFKGRVSRGNFLGELLTLNLISYFFLEAIKNETSLFIKMIFLITYLFFTVKINIRRLHDFNFSGWYSIIFLIPFGLYLLGLLTKWDFLMSIILSGWNVLFGIIIIYNLILLIMPGNKFTNTYGDEK